MAGIEVMIGPKPMGKNRFPSRAFPLSRLAAGAFLLAGLLYPGCSQPEEENACPGDGTQILLTSPKGGETFKIGDSLHVKWKLCNSGPIDINAVDPMLSPDGGTTWCYLKQNSIPIGAAGFGDYAWKIPDSITLQGEWFQLKGNAKCRIKVEQYSTYDAKQISIGGVFTIK
jgi:hypothetical protein